MIAAVMAEVVFISVFVASGAPVRMAPGRVNWGLPALPASSAAVGVVMVAIIIAAERSGQAQPAAGQARQLHGGGITAAAGRPIPRSGQVAGLAGTFHQWPQS